ncbi:hypothetical protein H8959_006633, partial [Pygathrix nigripes]
GVPAVPLGCGPARPGPSSSSAAGPAAGSGPCAGAVGGAYGGDYCKPRRLAWTGGREPVRCRARRQAGRPKTATPSPIPSPTPASEPESEFESASSCRRPLLIPPVRPVGPGRALLLLPVEQVGGGRRQESPRAGRAGEAAPGELQGRRGPWSPGPLLWLGICRVTCLYGQVQVFGFTISQGQPARDIFSVYTHSCLSIHALHYSLPEKSKKELKREARNLLKSHLNLDDRRWSMQNFSLQCSIVLLEHLETASVNFITSYPGSSYIFVQESPTPQIKPEYLALRSVGIRKEKKRKGLQLTESTLSALEELVNVSCEEVDGCPVILVCGSQDVGKSTFNRYLINQLLNSVGSKGPVPYVTTDYNFKIPGASEKIGAREPEEAHKEKLYRRPKFCRKMK